MGRLFLNAKTWLTPPLCKAIFVFLMVLNFFISLRYLTKNSPIDLSGDEAQYWDWSRHLDLSYYSKGPMVAYIIRASCALMGDTMPAVRLPALILAIGTSICTYWLTRKLFCSDRLALGAVLISTLVPMFAAGALLMTIDPPLYFLWALATCFAVIAIFDNRKWAWIAAGIVAGLGVLTKYAMLLWPPFVLLFLAFDSTSRSKLKTVWPWIMTAITFLFLTPVVIWNAQHDWVSLHHVATQTGADSSGTFSRGNLLEFLAAQFGAVNPGLAILLVSAAVYAIRKTSASDPHRRGLRFLLCIGGSMFGICLIDSLRAKVQANWPAPAYFTLMILTAYFISTHWKQARICFYVALIFGIAIQPILGDLTRLYPIVAWANQTFPDIHLKAKNVDLEYKLRGIADPFAKSIDEDLLHLPPGGFVLCETYEDASQLAFYLPGHPKTYFAGSYWTDLAVRRRWTQFDLWPDRQLNRPELIGKDAIYIGFSGYAPLRQSFKSVERLPDIVVRVRGLEVQTYTVWKCTDFKGMDRPPGEGPR